MDTFEKIDINTGCDPADAFNVGGCGNGFNYAATLIDNASTRNMKGVSDGIPKNTQTLFDSGITTNNSAFANSIGYNLDPTWVNTLDRVATQTTPGLSYFSTSGCSNCNVSGGVIPNRVKTGGYMQETHTMIIFVLLALLVYIYWDKIVKFF